MKPGRPAASTPQAAGAGRRHGRRPAEDGDQRGLPAAAAPAQPSEAGLAEGDDFAAMLDAWWDRILQFFVRHRATAVLAAWLGVFAFDVVDLHMPAEWLVFTFFSFSVFVQVFGMSILLFAALTAAMTALNVTVYCLLPFAATSLLSTVVVCMLLVRGVHGLDSRGWAITALMSLSRLNTPWCETLPDYLQAPVAAYCASFGLLWIVYHSSSRLEHLVDPLCLVLGVIPPPPPRLSVVEIGDTSAVVCWSQDIAAGGLLTAEPESARSSSVAHHKGAAPPPDVSPPPTPASPAEQPAPAPCGPAGDSVVRIGCFATVERCQLPEACISHYEVEVDGRVVGACRRTDEAARVQGLQPARTYQIRVWALSESRGRAPSAPVFVTTSIAPEGAASDNHAHGDQSNQQALDGSPLELESVHKEIADVHAATSELEETAAALRAQAEADCGRLQKEIAELRLRRKETEAAKAAQRDRIRELEAEKRLLDKEKAALRGEIAEAESRRQRAQQRRRDHERRTEEHLRQARLLQAKIERERRDHENELQALRSTIDSLKLEAARAIQRAHDLSQEQEEAMQQLRDKQAGLAAQEEENAGLDGRVKRAIQRRRQLRTSQRESLSIIARLQAEVDALAPQLDEATAQRRRLAAAAAAGLALPSHAIPAIACPLPVHPASYGGGSLGRRDLGAADVTAAANFMTNSLPPRLRSGSRPADSDAGGSARASGRHGRSSSFVVDSMVTGTAAPPLPFRYAAHHGTSSIGGRSASIAALGEDSLGYDGAPSRRSADLGDLLGFWSRKSPGLAADMPPAIGLRAPPWSSSSCTPPISPPTTAAEASALSILKDTDLAYPTPKRPSYSSGGGGGGSGPFCGGTGYRNVPFPQPPPEAHSGYSGKLHNSALGRMLADPLEGAGRVHAHLGLPRLRAASGWPDADHSQRLPLGTGVADRPVPGRVSVAGDQHSPSYVDPLASDSGPFVLRAGSPAGRPQHLFAGDVLGMHRPADIYTPVGKGRPRVAPIGAPVRRRHEAPPAPRRPPARSHEDLPLAGAGDEAETDNAPPLAAGSQSCRASMDHGAARSSPFNESLYCEHSFWERDADAHGPPAPAQPNNRHE
ncbi:hypothetical protein LPJ61_001502 [Coemansia biformis]|uniref:Fibronectin type-III domain-containing protein n=1 Tax=Coemansia biformis TaxID=1286918 RepID=A0A9W8CY19_9FUNG|nr:hypothetical protein LPJ61_001502 [Coemansia biformis]